MAIFLRCENLVCRTYYSVKHKSCPKCNSKSKTYYISYREDNKQKWEFAGNSLSEAKNKEEFHKAAKKQNIIKIMTHDFIQNIFKPYYLKKNAHDKKKREITYDKHIDNVTKGLPNKWLYEISPADIDECLHNVLDRGCKINTRNRHLALFSTLFNFAIERGYLELSPVKAKPIKYDDSRMMRLGKEVAGVTKEQFLEACKQSESPALYGKVMLALHTSMRDEPIREFKKSWVVDDIIVVPPKFSKKKSKYIIPLTPELKAYLNTIDDDMSFNMDTKTAFNSIKKKLGLKDFRFHDLRHNFASELGDANVSEKIISELLGHVDTKMAKRYTHLSSKTLVNAIEKLDNSGYKLCPDCAEEVRVGAKKCRFCNHIFD